MKHEYLTCDRCGKPVLPSPELKEAFPRPWKIREKHIVTTIFFHKRSKVETCDLEHDLCNDCMADFVKWWNEGKENTHEQV